MYLKDVSKKKDSSKKNGPPSFQAAFENLVASRSGALALRPGSVVEEMPPRKNKPKKRKPEGMSVQTTDVKQEGGQIKQEKGQPKPEPYSSDVSVDNSDSCSSSVVAKSDKGLQRTTESDGVKQVVPKKKPRKENPKTGSYPFLPLTQNNMTTQQQSQSDFNRINFLMPTIRWIEQQQMLQNNTKGKHTAESAFNQSSGVSFGDLLSATATQSSRDGSYLKQEGRSSTDSQNGANAPKSLTVVSPKSIQGTADYIKTIRMKPTPSATVTSEQKQEGGSQALDLSFSSSTSSESNNSDKKSVLENCATSEASDFRNLDPKPPDIMNAPPMKLTGSQQSLFSSMSEAFKVANSMLAQKPATPNPSPKSPRSLLSPGRQRIAGTTGLAETVSHDHGSLGSPPQPFNVCGATTCVGSSSLSTNSPTSPHSSQRPPQAHMTRPSNPNPRLQQLNPAVSSTAQSNLLLQALSGQQNLTSQQQQTFLVNIPVMHSGTTTGSSSTCITPTSTTTNASQVKQNIVLTNGVLLNNMKSSASAGTVVSSKPTVSQLLKATRGLTNSESKSQILKTGNTNTATKYVQMKSASGTISLLPVVSQAGGNAILLQNQSAANVIQIASTANANTVAGNIIVQPTPVQKVNNRLVQQAVTSPLRIAVSPQAVPNTTLCIISQTTPVGVGKQHHMFAMAGKPQANVVASAPVLGQKTATVPQFGGRPQFPGTTQFLLQGVTQIHPAPTAFQVDAKTPHFQTVLTSTQPCSESGNTTQPVNTVSLNTAQVSEVINRGHTKKANGVGLGGDMDQTYGAIVSPNKVLQLVPQPIVPISQVSNVTSITTTTSTLAHQKMATDVTQEKLTIKVSKKDSDSGDGTLENKVKAGLLSPSSNQSLYRMSSPGSDDKTLVQVSSYSAFSGNHPNKRSPNKADNSGSDTSPNKVSVR